MEITKEIIDELPVKYGNIIRNNDEIHFYMYEDEFNWEYINTDKICVKVFTDKEKMIEEVVKYLKTIKKATAYCDFQLDVTCPYCEHNIDLINPYYDIENENSKLIFGDWGKVNKYITCGACNKTFILNGIEY